MTEKQLLQKLSKKVKNYHDLCIQYKIKELTEKDFTFLPQEQIKKALAQHKIQNICKFFNGSWIPNWSNYNEYKHYPYFSITSSGGLVFHGCDYGCSAFGGEPGFYQSYDIAEFCGKTFIDVYKDLM